MNRLRYWAGRYRLAWRYCPACNSSPPRPECPVCQGSYEYGTHASGLGGPLTDTMKRLWLDRWNRLFGR